MDLAPPPPKFGQAGWFGSSDPPMSSSSSASSLSSPSQSDAQSPRDYDNKIYPTDDVFDPRMFSNDIVIGDELDAFEPNDSIMIIPFAIPNSQNPHKMFIIDNPLVGYKDIIKSNTFCSRPGGVSEKYAVNSFINTTNSGIICIIITRPQNDGTFINFLTAFATIRIERNVLHIEVICSEKFTLHGKMLFDYIKWLASSYGIHEIHLEAVPGAIDTYKSWMFIEQGVNQDGLTPMIYTLTGSEPQPLPPSTRPWDTMNLGNNNMRGILYNRFVDTSTKSDPRELDQLVFNQKMGNKSQSGIQYHPSVDARNARQSHGNTQKSSSVSVDMYDASDESSSDENSSDENMSDDNATEMLYMSSRKVQPKYAPSRKVQPTGKSMSNQQKFRKQIEDSITKEALPPPPPPSYSGKRHYDGPTKAANKAAANSVNMYSETPTKKTKYPGRFGGSKKQNKKMVKTKKTKLKHKNSQKTKNKK